MNFTDVQSPEVFENTTTGSIVGSLLALDSDANQDLRFSLDDDSQGEFSLNSSGPTCLSLANDQNKTKCAIKLLLSKPLNYEMNTERFISVRVTDTHGLFRVQKFTINVLDCNDAPTGILLGGSVTAVVLENSDGAFVGELRTIDEDSSQNWTYHLPNNFGLFDVVGKYIYINEGSHLNYEANSTYILSVKSLDNGVPAYGISRNFTIVVADVNEVPTKIILSNKEISENSSPGTVIANLTVDDPDNLITQRQTHSCSVVGQNKLRIDSGRLVNSVALDFERTPFVNFSIECTDSGTPTLKYKEDFAVIVKDENEAPSDIILSSLVVLENQDSGVIGKFIACVYWRMPPSLLEAKFSRLNLLHVSTLFYPTLPFPTLLCSTLPFPTLLCSTSTYPTLPCPALPYPTLPYLLLPTVLNLPTLPVLTYPALPYPTYPTSPCPTQLCPLYPTLSSQSCYTVHCRMTTLHRQYTLAIASKALMHVGNFGRSM